MLGIKRRIAGHINKTFNYSMCEMCGEEIHIDEWEQQPVGYTYVYVCPECDEIECAFTISEAKHWREND